MSSTPQTIWPGQSALPPTAAQPVTYAWTPATPAPSGGFHRQRLALVILALAGLGTLAAPWLTVRTWLGSDSASLYGLLAMSDRLGDAQGVLIAIVVTAILVFAITLILACVGQRGAPTPTASGVGITLLGVVMVGLTIVGIVACNEASASTSAGVGAYLTLAVSVLLIILTWALGGRRRAVAYPMATYQPPQPAFVPQASFQAGFQAQPGQPQPTYQPTPPAAEAAAPSADQAN